jgi:hypothetical protein
MFISKVELCNMESTDTDSSYCSGAQASECVHHLLTFVPHVCVDTIRYYTNMIMFT